MLLTKCKTPYIIDPQKKKATPTSRLFCAVISTAKPQYAICMFAYYHILLLNVNNLCAVEKGKFCQWQKQKSSCRGVQQKKIVTVKGYTTKNGTKVKQHRRSTPN